MNGYLQTKLDSLEEAKKTIKEVVAEFVKNAIEPKGENAKVLFRYKGDNKTAGVCFDGNCHSVILGFPFETITTDHQRDELMGQILKYWGLKE